MKYGKGFPPPGFNRRTVQSYLEKGVRWLSPQDLLKIMMNYSEGVNSSSWNLKIRNKALFSWIVLSCCRISEALTVKKSQVNLNKDPEFVIIENFQIRKRKKGKKFFLIELPFTKKKNSILYPFTEAVLEHLETVKKDDERLFSIGSRRAEQIICSMDPILFPHFIRACSLSYFINTLKDPVATARIFGVQNLNTLMRYYGKTWEEYRAELSL